MKKQLIIAISGLKNVGKTTLIQNIIPILNSRGYKVATIKHDGHDFLPDVPNTDTYKHRESGAYGVAIFSKNRFMVSKDVSVDENDIVKIFPEADIILLEGFKNSDYMKIEVIREEVSKEPYCKNNVIAYYSDVTLNTENKVIMQNNYLDVADCIISFIN